MFTNRNQASYRTAMTSGATQIGLLLVTYDALAEDLRQAGEATARGEIGHRCTKSNHALLLVGHLESWLSTLEDAALTGALQSWYGYVREQLLALQVRGTREDFLRLAALVLEVRSSWQAKEEALTAAFVPSDPTKKAPLAVQPGVARSGWSA